MALPSVAFLLLSLPAFGAASPALHVMVDAGHGGVDKGAVRGHLHESEIALKVANELAQLLREDSQRFKVSMTRTTDTKVSLKSRTEMAKDAKADLFVSIHLNSSVDARARGKEIYFQNQLPAEEDVLFLASRENTEEEETLPKTESKNEPFSSRTDLKRILEDLNRNQRILSSSKLSKILLETWETKHPALRFGSRAIRQAPFQVVSSIAVPSVLVEIGFISHAQEGPLLAQATYQKQVARSLYEGLIKYRSEVKRDGNSPSDKESVDNDSSQL